MASGEVRRPLRRLTDWAFSCRRALAANAETPKTWAYYQTIKLATRKPVSCNALLGGGRDGGRDD